MKRPYVIVFMVLLAGCASRKPLAPDPFFGRTAIPPPSTGASSAPSSRDPYYAASAGLSAVPRDTDDRVEAASSSASWSKPEDVTAADYAVPSASSTVAAADTDSTPTSEDRAEVSGNSNSSWTVGSRDPAAIRTRINPPDYASHATHEQPAISATNSTAERSSSSVAADCVSTKASPGEPERIIRVMQPLATAAGRKPKEPKKTSPASQPGTSTASSSTASWHNRSAASRTTTSGGSVAPASTPSTFVAEQAPRRIILPDRVIDIMDLPDAGMPTARQAKVDRNVRPASNFATTRAT
ncbi:MAG: hypothetical protein JW888_12045, partial [Pirellulales bacterium]|nr:hypothetical protein [Pirellulales bacterium]